MCNLVLLLPFLYFYNYFEMININNFKYNNIKIFFLKYYSNHHYPFKYQMFSYLINNYVISKISLILYLIIKIKQKV